MIATLTRRALSFPGWAALLAAFVASLAAAFLAGGRLQAAEPAQEFLTRLRDEGYYDTAIDYLDQIANSPLVSDSFKQSIAYERGVTLMEGARHQKDFSLREKQLDAAQVAFDQFVKAQPAHPMFFSAKSELGNLMVERANLKLERIKRPSEAQKDKLRTEARDLYVQAQKLFDGLGDELRAKLKEFPAQIDEKKEAKRFEQRAQLRSDFLQAELLSAGVLEKTADTMQKGSKEYNDTLTKAATAYGEIYKNYRQKLAGLYARMYQGRCYQSMDNFKEALSYYDELLANPDEPRDFHELRTKVLLQAVDCWMHDSQKKYGEVISKAGAWVERAYPAEIRSVEMQGLRLATARASKLLSDQVKAQKPKDPQVNQLLTDARKLVQYVAKFPGPLQKDAQKMLVDLGVASGATEGEKPDPKTFAEARQAGKEALDAVNIAKVNLESLPGRIKEEKDEAVKKELEEQLKQAQETEKSGFGEAHRMFKLALRLVNSETTDDEVNAVRYYLTFLDYSMGSYADAAVLGEFVSRRFPESAAARSAGELAMASYIKMYGDAKAESKPNIDKLLGDFDKNKDGRLSQDELNAMPDESKTPLAKADVDGNGKIELAELVRLQTRFESERVIDICNYITGRWPDQPEGQKALTTLIDFMISENQLDKAIELLKKIPEDTAFRGAAELKLGQALWGAYLRGMQATHDQEAAASQAGPVDAALKTQLDARRDELKAYKTQAEKILTDGVERMEKAGKIDAVFASAVLSLAQIYVDTEQAAKAIPLLEKPNVGTLWLVQQKNAAASKPATIEETFKTSLRAYISALAAAKGDASAELIKKAEGVMASLNESVAGQPDGAKNLFRIYFTLARDLERQMQLAEPETKKNLAKGFETFLNQVRATGSELNVLYWVATTFHSMGENSPTAAGGAASEDAKRYFGEAVKTYDDILARGKAGTIQMDDQLRGQIMMQLATSKRAMGDYEGAIKLFMEVLAKNNTLLSVQSEACKTYEEWAEKGGNAKYYLHAMQGSLDKRPKGTIWGWMQISTITAGKPAFRDAFYEARYHIALAQYKYALAPANASSKAKHLAAAEQSLSKTVALYPNLAGDPAQKHKSFVQQYDGLAKLLQQAQNKPVKGLAAYEQPPAGAAPTGAAPAGAVPPGAVPAAAGAKK
ncbi:MAG: EF-hand domain-containing protein [Pirellulales bacterium]